MQYFTILLHLVNWNPEYVTRNDKLPICPVPDSKLMNHGLLVQLYYYLFIFLAAIAAN